MAKKANTFALIAAILFVVCAVYNFYSGIIAPIITANSYGGLFYSGPQIAFSDVLYILALAFMAVVLFLKHKTLMIVSASVLAFMQIIFSSQASSLGGFGGLLGSYNPASYMVPAYVFAFLAYAAMIVTVILAKKQVKAVKYIWYIAGALLSVGYVIMISYLVKLMDTMSYLGGGEYVTVLVLPILIYLVEIGAMFLMGLWMNGSMDTVSNPAIQSATIGNDGSLRNNTPTMADTLVMERPPVQAPVRKAELNVTREKIYGVDDNGKAVDIPVKQITGLRDFEPKGVEVATANGAFRFSNLANQQQVIESIARLLTEM